MQLDRWTRGIRDPHWWARLLVFAFVIGVLLGVVGPFGTFVNDALLVRVLYFIAMTMTGAVVTAFVVPSLLLRGVCRIRHRMFRQRSRVPSATRAIGACDCATG